MHKKIDKHYIFLVFIGLFLVLLVTPSDSLFGSTIDWVSQHVSLPSYFRELFYETGNLFPNFAPSIGAGQNIFHFSYYGLFHPFVLLSYLFPFWDMTSYLIFIHICLYLASALLLYKWLTKHFSSSVSFFASVLLLCASPFLFHFHRHFMFVSYMPFLILGLIGVESYFEKGKKYLLLLSTFFIILMSYFYSIPSILVFVFYGVFYYLKQDKKITFSLFMKDGILFLLPICAGILLSSFFLLPTFYTVLSGRGGGNTFSLSSLFFPHINMDSILYDHYGMGLTSLAVLGLLYGVFSKDRAYKVLSICLVVLFCFPIFSYLLNGTLYIRSKVFIPFLPLFLFLVCHFITCVLKGKIPAAFPFFTLDIHILFLLFRICPFYYYIDLGITVLMLWFLYRGVKILYGFLLLPFGVCLFVNHLDTYVKKDIYYDSTGISSSFHTYLKKDDSFFRTYHLKNSLYNVNRTYGAFYHVDSLYSSIYHEEYRDFYHDVFPNPISYRNKLVISQNDNLLYQIYMGGKYLYSDSDMIGYKKIGNFMYQNDDVFPVLYASNHLLSLEEFEKLPYPERVFTLLQNTVIEGESRNESFSLQTLPLPTFSLSSSKNVKVEKRKEGYKVKAKKNNKLVFTFQEPLQNKIILLDFVLENARSCAKGDSAITVLNHKNVLTCKDALYKNENHHFHYVLSDSTLQDIDVTFTEGTHFIRDIHMYLLNYQDISPLHTAFTAMKVDREKSIGDRIVGTIHVSEDGYFVTSIPFDQGFTIYDNGKKVQYEKVNTAFLGFPIQKGTHLIQIEYRAPYFFLGKCISIFMSFFLCVFTAFRCHKCPKK